MLLKLCCILIWKQVKSQVTLRVSPNDLFVISSTSIERLLKEEPLIKTDNYLSSTIQFMFSPKINVGIIF